MCGAFYSSADGLESAEANQTMHIYGVNLIDIVLLPLHQLTIKEVYDRISSSWT